MASRGKKPASKRELTLVALMECETHEDAAARAGISARTLRHWLKQPDFLAEYRRLRREVVEHSIGRIQHATGEAMTTLRRLLSCGHAPTERAAAEAILSHARTGIETVDLLERLEQVEATLKERTTP